MSENHQNKTVGKKQQKTWWKNNKQPLIIVAVSIIVLLLIFTLAVLWFGWDWTGFNSATGPTLQPNEQFRPAKTLWDAQQLLIIPIILAIGGFWLNQIQKDREEKISKLRTDNEQKIATDNQREAALQTYIDKMSELLLNKDNPLRGSKPEDEVRKIARVRTLTVLPRLDKDRKRNILLFLYESGLIYKGRRIIDLEGADLSNADLNHICLCSTSQPYSPQEGSDLSGVNLSGANLDHADLLDADLSRTNLNGANLRSSYLWDANLYAANLCNTDLSYAMLLRANLTGIQIRGANLEGATLKDAKGITPEDMEKQIRSLRLTTMPDGSKHP